MDDKNPSTAFVMVAEATWLDAHGAKPERNKDH